MKEMRCIICHILTDAHSYIRCRTKTDSVECAQSPHQQISAGELECIYIISVLCGTNERRRIFIILIHGNAVLKINTNPVHNTQIIYMLLLTSY